jgi:hypothetical protein
VVWHRYAVVRPSKGGNLHTPAWQQVNPDKPHLLAISSAGGNGEVIDGPSWLTGPFGEPVSAKVTGGADRRQTKLRIVRGKGECFSPSLQVRAERSSKGTGPMGTES